mmetsp:Transcript_20678/g.31626  ORF Transcript_20678/g.31626 Transcript_20678/m.31626 type:complete len:194 (+) Transcript_20678:1711-2292(+)
MTIMFQVDDLSQASPATISRCGMVLLESAQLGHGVFITSYCNELRRIVDDKICDKVEKVFHYIMDISVEFTRKNGKFPCSGNGSYLVNHIIKIIQCYMAPYKPNETDGEEAKVPNDIEDKLMNALLFASIWGIGGAMDEFTRPRFSQMLQEMLNGEDIVAKYQIDMGDVQHETMKVPNKITGDYKSLFDLYFD